MLIGLSELQRAIMIAAGQGRTRRSEIENAVSGFGGTRRIDRHLETLIRTNLLRDVRPLGAPRQARPEIRVTDTYLKFWFSCLANHVQSIEGGQIAAVLDSITEEWQKQLVFVFEQAARDHAIRLVREGRLPSNTLIGEWWQHSGNQVQVDVLGLKNNHTAVLGEAKWQSQELGRQDLNKLGRALQFVPNPIPNPVIMLWGRHGVHSDILTSTVWGFGPEQMLQ